MSKDFFEKGIDAHHFASTVPHLFPSFHAAAFTASKLQAEVGSLLGRSPLKTLQGGCGLSRLQRVLIKQTQRECCLTMKGIGTHLPGLKTAAHGERDGFFSAIA